MHSIWQTLVLFFNIAVFKARPQDLPASSGVFYLGIGLALLLSLLRYAIAPTESYSILRVVLEVVMPGFLLYLLLYFYKHTSRFTQAFAAICGSGSIIYTIALPILPAFYAAAQNQTSDLSIYLIILLDIWSVAVLSYILKHTLELRVSTSISLAIALGLITFVLIESISPGKKIVPSESVSAYQSMPAIHRSAG